jgi:hypothetical protein
VRVCESAAQLVANDATVPRPTTIATASAAAGKGFSRPRQRDGRDSIF